jgi:tetratricopeptide (TPR) repeat protein
MKKIIKYIKRFFRFSSNTSPLIKEYSQIGKSQILDSDIGSKSFLDESKGKMLSNQEIGLMIEKAESQINSKNLKQALQTYKHIIDNTKPESYFFKRRGWINRMLGNPDGAIEDYSKAIELDPDDGTTYWEIAPCYTYNLSRLGYNENEKRKTLLGKALYNYKAAVERIPTSPEAWLAIIETELRLFEYDDAISSYGTCKPYIISKEYQTVRSWLGCIALTLEGDTIEKEDEKSLNDTSIRLNRNSWSLRAIDLLLIELGEQKSFDKGKLQKVIEIHQKFINHFDELPIRLDQKLTKK